MGEMVRRRILSDSWQHLRTSCKFSIRLLQLFRRYHLKVPASFTETDSPFLIKLQHLLDSVCTMPDGIGMVIWKSGLENIITANHGKIVIEAISYDDDSDSDSEEEED